MKREKKIVHPKIISSEPTVDFVEIYSECLRDEDYGHLFFLGVLAYPQLKERNHVINFVLSVLSEKSKALSEFFRNKKLLDKRLKGFEARKAKRIIDHVFKRIRDRRFFAIHLALNCINKFMPNIHQAALDTTDFINYGPKVHREKMSLLLLEENRMNKEIEINNVYKIIWSESKPVLHMAMALFPLMHNWPKSKKSISMDEVIHHAKNTSELNIIDLFLASRTIAMKLNIIDEIDLMSSSAWVDDILKVSRAFAFILPQQIPTIKKHDLIKI